MEGFYFLEVNFVIVNCFLNLVDVMLYLLLFVLVLGFVYVFVFMEFSVVSVVYYEDFSLKLFLFFSWIVLWLL